MLKSSLKINPKSKVLRHGYIKVYTTLTPQEEKGLRFKEKHKEFNPGWDDSLVILCNKLDSILSAKSDKTIKVLDAGCGHGNYLIDEYRTQIDWAVGVDLKPEFTRRNICLDEIISADLANLPLDDNFFDICTCLWVLEHLQEPAVVLKEIYRVLKPGGWFLFVTPNTKSLLIILRRLFRGSLGNLILENLYGRSEQEVFPTLYRANEVKTLQYLLQESGFTKIALKPNYDPSYTSFGELTFRLSNFMDKLLSSLGSQLTQSHLVGSAQKPEQILPPPSLNSPNLPLEMIL